MVGLIRKKGAGSFGAVIADQSIKYATILGSAPGRPDLHCSFRPELYGLLAACSLLNEILNFYRLYGKNTENQRHILSWQSEYCWLGTQTLATTNTVTKSNDSCWCRCRIANITRIEQIGGEGYKILPFCHVQAHQDQRKSYSDLSRDAQLNVTTDRLAAAFPNSGYVKQVYHPPSAAKASLYPPSATKASLYINSIAIMSWYKVCLRDVIHTPALREYIQKKWEWTDSTFDGIWWKAHGIALKILSHSDGQKFQKFNYNHLPTNRRLSKFHLHIASSCPSCSAVEETDDHVILCHTNKEKLEAKQIWESDMYHYLSAEHTPSMVRTAIVMLGFHHWIYNKPIPPLAATMLAKCSNRTTS